MANSPAHAASGVSAEEMIDKAVANAKPNVLRLALYQATKDPALARMEAIKVPFRGGALEEDAVADRHLDELRRKAVAYLRQRMARPQPEPAPPSRQEAYEMLQMFSASPLSETDLRFGWEELAFDEYPRDVTWTHKPPAEVLENFKVLVVGAGISGIAFGVSLTRLGIPYTILEKSPSVGGVWWTNQYPDCRVDVTSYLYQYKFEKNYPWADYYATRDSNLKYLQHVAAKHGVMPHVRLDSEVIRTRWLDADKLWAVTVRRSDGSEETLKANVLISAVGLFATPKLPDIDGIESFQGAKFHTTQWNHEFDYRGKRVGLIGNGSTGSQLMPGIAAAAAHLTVFQRTPQWVMPAENYRAAISDTDRWLLDNMPFYWNWYCYSSFATTSRLEELQAYDPEWQAAGGTISKRNDKLREILVDYIQRKVGSRPDLHAKVMPTFAPLGRRSVIDNGWYDALLRDNVELVTEKIVKFTPQGVLTADGREHPLDMIILAAGFQTSRYLWPVEYAGRNGRTLEELWSKDGARSYLGITLPEFPNFFISYGPNGQPRSGGFNSWAEIWSRYVLSLVTQMIENGKRSIELRREVFDDYNERQDAEMPKLIWQRDSNKGYYVNEFGRVGLNVPWKTSDYYEMVAAPDLSDYTFG